MRISEIILISSILLQTSIAWSPMLPNYRSTQITTKRGISSSTTTLSMALDYNDPIVAEEFAKAQSMTFEDCEEEINAMGIPVPKMMSETDVKLMLVELRMSVKKQEEETDRVPETFSSPFEEAYHTKPQFKDLYKLLKANKDTNAVNVCTEYLNNREIALSRYEKDYKTLLTQLDNALNAMPPLTSPTLIFSGFPANMGEAGCKMTLEALGEIVDFECESRDDLPILEGKVTFGDIETATAAVSQYNGMDMGMGTKIVVKGE